MSPFVYQLNLFAAHPDCIRVWSGPELLSQALDEHPAKSGRTMEVALAVAVDELQSLRDAFSGLYSMFREDIEEANRVGADDDTEVDCFYAEALEAAAEVIDSLKAHWPSFGATHG